MTQSDTVKEEKYNPRSPSIGQGQGCNASSDGLFEAKKLRKLAKRLPPLPLEKTCISIADWLRRVRHILNVESCTSDAQAMAIIIRIPTLPSLTQSQLLALDSPSWESIQETVMATTVGPNFRNMLVDKFCDFHQGKEQPIGQFIMQLTDLHYAFRTFIRIRAEPSPDILLAKLNTVAQSYVRRHFILMHRQEITFDSTVKYLLEFSDNIDAQKYAEGYSRATMNPCPATREHFPGQMQPRHNKTYSNGNHVTPGKRYGRNNVHGRSAYRGRYGNHPQKYRNKNSKNKGKRNRDDNQKQYMHQWYMDASI